MNAACLNLQTYFDDTKLIEFQSSDNVYSDNIPGLNAGEGVGSSLDTLGVANTILAVDQEYWDAPFQDYDFSLDSAKAVCQKETFTANTTDASRSGPGKSDLMASMSPHRRLYGAAMTVKSTVKFTRLERAKKRARWLTKKIIVFVLSHVGLTSLVGLYAVAGGFIFQRLERNFGFGNTEAIQGIRNIALLMNFSAINTETFLAIRSQHVDSLWNITVNLNVLEPIEWKKIVHIDLQMFERDIYKAIMRGSLERREEVKSVATEEWTDSHRTTGEWTYPSALLFAVTVITTIGYGDTVPKSGEAKMVCIVYAVFGIPLTLLCLANIGSLLASVYRFTWKHTSHLTLVIVRAPGRNKPLVETSQVRVPIWISVTTMIVYILGGAAIFSEWENWTFLEGFYFCFITLSTIGFGDYVPGKDTETLDSNAKRVVCALYLLFGLALLSMMFQLIQDSVTLVIGRYASFLGLSQAQIEKDILETSALRKCKEVRGEVKAKGSMEQVTRDAREVEYHDVDTYPVQVPETCHNIILNGPEEMLEKATKTMYSLQRAKTMPVQGTNRTPEGLAPKLQAVLEESSCRRTSSICPDGSHGAAEAGAEDDQNSQKDFVSRRHSVPSVAVSQENLQG